MKAEVAFTPLLSAARALKPYTTPQRWSTRTRLLYLHADGDTLTLSASTGDETAAVPLSGAVSEGWCVLPPDTLIKALTVIKPRGKAAQRAVVTLHAEDGRLDLAVGDAPAIVLDTERLDGPPPTVATQPTPTQRLVTVGPVADWVDLIAGVALAAGREAARPDLSVIRLLRDHPQVVLVVEATDSRRIHRGTWGQPGGDPLDVRIPVDAAGRAVRLLRTLDPAGHVRIHADDRQLVWRTDQVRLAATTGGRFFPNLETLREDVLNGAAITFTVERAELLAAVSTAHTLTATSRRPTVRLEPNGIDALNVVVRTDAGAPMHTEPLTVRYGSGPGQALTLDPGFARDALTFLDGDDVAVHAHTDRLPIYLAGQRRHAIVMQIAA
jgi:hypothetical protein